MLYFIQVNIYAALMYIIYLGLLRNRTWHSFSRVYLLLNAIVPLVLPFIQLPVSVAALQKSNSVSNIVLPVVNISARAHTSLHISAGMPSGWMIFYVLLSVLLLTRLMMQIGRIRRFIAKHPAQQHGQMEVIHDANLSPGSWKNYIFLPQADIDPSILAHEEAHVRLRHSYDLLLLRLLQCLFWPDVIFQYIIKEMKVVHEFQADSYSANSEAYIAAMLNDTFGTKIFSLSHTFFHHPLKRRITMLQNTNKSRAPYLLTTVLCLIMLGSILLVQCAKPVTPKTVVPIVKMDSVYTYVDSMPKSIYDVNQFISANLVYPAAARAKNIEGRVVTRFVVDENGKITDITILNSPDSTLSNAALDVIRRMPDWKPGILAGHKVKVAYILPISFKLE